MNQSKVAIWSLFRDDEKGDYLDQYLYRIRCLSWPRDKLRFYLVEGDSKDNTFEVLKEKTAGNSRIKVLKCDSGMPDHGSKVHPERFAAVSRPGNYAVDEIVHDDWADVAMLIESDLLYAPDLIERLSSHLPDEDAVIAPMIWISYPDGKLRFYDIWGFRFEENDLFPPETPQWFEERFGGNVTEIWSAGSVVMFPFRALAEGARYSEVYPEAIMGFTRQAAALGCRIYCDPATHVTHPPRP